MKYDNQFSISGTQQNSSKSPASKTKSESKSRFLKSYVDKYGTIIKTEFIMPNKMPHQPMNKTYDNSFESSVLSSKSGLTPNRMKAMNENESEGKFEFH